MHGREILGRTALMMIMLVALLAAIGCGDTSGPSATVNDFISATQNKDCQKMFDLIDPQVYESRDMNRDQALQSFCSNAQETLFADEIVSNKVVEESIDGDKATLKVETVSKSSDGKESTSSETLILYNRNGSWKISFE